MLLSHHHLLLSLTDTDGDFYESLQPFYHDYEDDTVIATTIRTHPAFADATGVYCRHCAIVTHTTVGVERIEKGLSVKLVPVTQEALEKFQEMTSSTFHCNTCDKEI